MKATYTTRMSKLKTTRWDSAQHLKTDEDMIQVKDRRGRLGDRAERLHIERRGLLLGEVAARQKMGEGRGHAMSGIYASTKASNKAVMAAKFSLTSRVLMSNPKQTSTSFRDR